MKTITKVMALLAFSTWASGASSAPITDTVNVDGTVWAQVNIFSGLSWNEVNQVCPGGTCTVGTLNGFDMEGWRWASFADIQNLFAHYIGAPIEFIDGFGRRVEEHNSSWAPAFFADGWARTAGIVTGQRPVRGILSTGVDSFRYYRAVMIDFEPQTNRADVASIAQDFQRDIGFGNYGAWFYQVPVPPTPLLFCAGLIAMSLSLRNWRYEAS